VDFLVTPQLVTMMAMRLHASHVCQQRTARGKGQAPKIDEFEELAIAAIKTKKHINPILSQI
jgi:hypothetical protein